MPALDDDTISRFVEAGVRAPDGRPLGLDSVLSQITFAEVARVRVAVRQVAPDRRRVSMERLQSHVVASLTGTTPLGDEEAEWSGNEISKRCDRQADKLKAARKAARDSARRKRQKLQHQDAADDAPAAASADSSEDPVRALEAEVYMCRFGATPVGTAASSARCTSALPRARRARAPALLWTRTRPLSPLQARAR
jgi:hypothetical protein